jgi:hypothetical protein
MELPDHCGYKGCPLPYGHDGEHAPPPPVDIPIVIMTCPYCGDRMAGMDKDSTWVRWLVEHYAHKHGDVPTVANPTEVEWEDSVFRIEDVIGLE